MYTKTIFLLLMVCTVNADAFSQNSRAQYGRSLVGDSVETVSMKMLKEIYKEADDKNVIASPLAVMLLLSLYAGGAGDQCRVEINNFLDEEHVYKNISEMFGNLSKQLAEQDPSYLTLANKVYVSDNYTLAEQFRHIAVDTFNSEVETINFIDTEAAAEKINQWADTKSRSHITNPIGPDTLDPNTVVALLNVIFFQGHWHVPFKKENTEDKDFYVDKDTIVKKPTMKLKKTLYYTKDSYFDIKMIELPYKENGFRMVVVLPNEIDGLPVLLDKLANLSLTNTIMKLAPSHRTVDLEMPKFEVKNSLNLKKVFNQLEVSKIFKEAAPGLVVEEPLVVSQILQDAFIRVDEEGASAGAHTGLVTVPKTILPPRMIDFKVNHPFLYLIMFEDKMLFVGTYTH